ncbi:metal ABC transporter solute-binding protein, Zn/Mn family [Agaribacterium haliotis]|uniref:metal ABC transporter solute-binding protein, Zn/Mn family n=1 Tax=Agaribacterium haliotis TaxID=2013869 RepID=UPI0013046EE1|nr:zinc ABC transporter substrate-binding protein [Agaribacterium haliotis]
MKLSETRGLVVSLIVLLGQLFLSTQSRADVLSSIRPLQLLASDLAPQSVRSDALLGPSDSPHHYALKPRDLLKLQQAELFIWVGPEFESLIAKAVEKQVDDQHLLTLDKLADAELHSANKHSSNNHAHQHGQETHLWLSFVHSRQFAERIAEKMIQHYPKQQAQIKQKLDNLLSDLDREYHRAKTLFSSSDKAFAVYHDAWGLYVNELGLKQKFAVNQLPDQQLHARQLYELKTQARGLSCLIADVDEFQAAQKLAARIDMQLVEVDLLAARFSVPAEGSAYVAYMKSIADGFQRCIEL